MDIAACGVYQRGGVGFGARIYWNISAGNAHSSVRIGIGVGGIQGFAAYTQVVV